MAAEVVQFPRNTSPEDLAEGFLEYAQAGNVKWAIMVICEPDDLLRFEWSRLPSNFTAIGAVEFLKRRLMEE